MSSLLSRAAVDATSLEVAKASLDRAWNNLEGVPACGRWVEQDCPFQPKPFQDFRMLTSCLKVGVLFPTLPIKGMLGESWKWRHFSAVSPQH